MSDSEDSDILADIKALDEALGLRTQNETQCSDLLRSNSFSSTRSTDSESSDDECFDYLSTIQYTDVASLNAYEINIKLTVGLKLIQKKLLNLLDKCEKKIKQLDDKQTNNTVDCSLYKLSIANPGMPYFKDKNLFRCPKNYDTKLKECRGELSVLSLSRVCRWSAKDKEALLKAIQNEASQAILASRFSQDTGKARKKTSDDQAEESTFVLPMNFKQMVGTLGEREFDWYKISVMDLENRHSPGECRAMWNVYLHPDIRKSGWTSQENSLLLQCVEDNNHQDWDTIAELLGTNRSAYQCFVRYNTIKKVPTGATWSKMEDKHLKHVINTLKTGDYIPWSEVSHYFARRTKQQIYARWMYRKSPHLKKGRFTLLENETLLKAVKKYGTDFTKISNKVMPNRCSSQLLEHYNRIMEKMSGANIWMFDDDVKLIHLRQTLGNNWVKIAQHFPKKSRTQVRQRYSALLRYTRRNIALHEIPRVHKTNHATRTVEKGKSAPQKLPLVTKMRVHDESPDFTVDMNDVHLRLYENLTVPPSKEPFDAQDERYDIEQLVRDTKKSYKLLHLLDARFHLPAGDFLDYVHLSKRDKQLFISLIEYINSAKNNHNQNNALVEQCRKRMFGGDPCVSEESRFIPPLPFNGYVRLPKAKRLKRHTSIDCDLDYEEKYLFDVPAYFFVSSHTLPFVSSEEEIQFDKLGEHLANHNFHVKTPSRLRSLRCTTLPSNRKTAAKKRAWEADLLRTQRLLQLHGPDEMDFECLDEVKEIMFSDLVPPNRATLLGLKNLLLWKLLYECQHQCDSALLGSEESDLKSPDYQLLRMRLLRLFKVPIGLSNIKLRISDPNVFFEVEQED